MRKIILFIHTTFNGVVTGDPSKDKTEFMVWTTDASVETGTVCLLKTFETVDTILLGRRTYEDLSRKWPSMNDSPLGKKINNAAKFVVTGDNTPENLKWGDFEAPKKITGHNIEGQLRDLKNNDGGDIVIFGSPTLVKSLTDLDLIDLYQIQIHPLVTNIGEHLFDGIHNRKDFTLVDVKALADGSIFVTYEPVN